ncbi:hypothetical protein [Erwinia persicina]|uniref:hypothetical protein n=1 Tax=Erwinia persicina TaxID=55211 RepID=UPI001780A766|nr:hypothetical protein [Erwinia persicina]MBD8216731.1 hypothetical protein [Erwinia persicina]
MTSTVFALVLHLMVGSEDMSADMGKYTYDYVSREECHNTLNSLQKVSIRWARFDGECIETPKTANTDISSNQLTSFTLVQGYLEGDQIQYGGPMERTWTKDMQSCQLAMKLIQREVAHRPSVNLALACIPSRQTRSPIAN